MGLNAALALAAQNGGTSAQIQSEKEVILLHEPEGEGANASYFGPRQFSYANVHATIILPFIIPGDTTSPTVRLTGLNFISISEHRDKFPVTGFGRSKIRGFTYGHRTTAGALGFNVFGQNPWAPYIAKYAAWRGIKLNDPMDAAFITPDELPPFDLSLVFFNDYGQAANLFIRSVVLMDSSKNISVNDIKLTDSYSFQAGQCTTLVETLRLSTGDETQVSVPQRKASSFLQKKTAPSTSTTSTLSTTSTTTTSGTTTTTATTTTATTTTTTTTTVPTTTAAPTTTLPGGPGGSPTETPNTPDPNF